MHFATAGTRKYLLSILTAGGISLMLAAGAPAQVVEQRVIDGTPVDFKKQSIKCELRDRVPANISIRRLADCYSAKYVVIKHDDIKIKAVKFTIKPETKRISNGVRAELRDMYEARNGEEVWYRFATMLPKDFAIDSRHRLVLAQWHERMHKGLASLRPPLSLRLWDGRLVVTLWNKQRVAARGIKGDGEILFDLPRMKRKIWYHFVYKVVWSPGEDGEVMGWLRECRPLDVKCAGSEWREIIRYEGSTGYDEADIESYYFKLGLYTVTDFDVPFTAFHKGYQIGRSAADVGANYPAFR